MFRRSLNPARGFFVALATIGLSVTILVALTASQFPTLNNILDTSAFLLSALVAALLWDLGWRTDQPNTRLKAICFGVFSLMALAHAYTALDVSMAHGWVQAISAQLRYGTLAPAAYLLPLALLAALWFRGREVRTGLFAAGLLTLGIALLYVQALMPSYASESLRGITRPTFLLLPLLWVPVIWMHFRIRNEDRLAHMFAWFGVLMALMPVFMMFSRSYADVAAMSGHFVIVTADGFLLIGLMRMGVRDTAQRMRVQQELELANATLETRVAERTTELAQLHASLKRAYDDLQLSQNTVMQQERLRALGQMASGIAHDINNAISPVSLYVESILTHEKGFSDRARKQLEIIQRSVEDVAHTVTRMGEFYRQRQDQAQLQPVEVNAVLADVLELTRARWSDMAQSRGAVIDTRIESEPDSPLVNAIESELREALINLVLNATDAMPEGGTLTLRAGYAGEEGKKTAERVFIEVCDTGTGMDEDTRRRCLEPFFSTKGARGSGLGLAMVYGIAQRHAVDIQLTSAPGQGTTFRLLFPFSALALRKTKQVPLTQTPAHIRILVVDDDPLLLASVGDALVNDGHEVQTANGGRAGIDAFLDAQQSGRGFPLVITDLGMPHVDGRAVAGAVNEAAPGTPVIMLTGWGQRLAASGDIPPGVSVVLSKPPKLAELRQWVAEFTDSGAAHRRGAAS